MKLVYICGPYRSPDPWKREQNVREAELLAYDVAKIGCFPVCPHANTRPYFEGVQNDEFWLRGTLKLLSVCDALITSGFWMESVGASAEVAFAKEHHIPVFHSVYALGAWSMTNELRENGAVEIVLKGGQR